MLNHVLEKKHLCEEKVVSQCLTTVYYHLSLTIRSHVVYESVNKYLLQKTHFFPKKLLADKTPGWSLEGDFAARWPFQHHPIYV